jgi:hypothetical protein
MKEGKKSNPLAHEEANTPKERHDIVKQNICQNEERRGNQSDPVRNKQFTMARSRDS